jgi:solute carrier family 29 (equilibrative nucleoside transporter), member 1/2/3
MATKSGVDAERGLLDPVKGGPAAGGGDDSYDPRNPPAGTPAQARLVYYIVVLQGFGLLISWNAILNVIPYFQHLYGNSNISFYLTSAYVYPQLPVLLLVTLYGHHVPFTYRIVGSLALMCALMASLPLLAPTGMWAALAVMVLNGVGTAVLQPSMIGFTSMFPPIFNQGAMFGQGISGVVACIANIIVLAALPNAQDTSANVYFAASAASIAVCLAAYLYILRLPFTKYYVERGASGSSPRGAIELEPLGPDGSAAVPGADDEREDAALVGGGGTTSKWSVLKRVWMDAASVWLVFTVSFCVFPGIAPFSIPFKHSLGGLKMSNDWWGIVLLTAFNSFDTMGRFLPSVVQLLRGKALFAGSVARLALIPAFIGAALSWAGWMSDVYAFIVMMVFATTNGYFASLAMMQGPMGVGETEREAAGFVMSLFLQFGIFSGSQIAMGLQKLI